ncbi:hypothetical protein HPB47_015154 [Ixodes persulcatus]|uniref:Uncharacterized protein n=1 Tax=Ixodes persulcatus TaxID=34615 RepID=A0AC60QU94_IXOPE|nr:hypothetical protein HPB47_015154 [Ixodes persulcatus]
MPTALATNVKRRGAEQEKIAQHTVGTPGQAVDDHDALPARASNFVEGMPTAETTAADIRSLEQEIARLNEEVYALRKKVEDSRFTAESFKEDDEKHSSQNSLGKFEEMMVFLMRLRLYLSVQDLAYRFQISASTVSRVFEKWLNVFYDRLVLPSKQNGIARSARSAPALATHSQWVFRIAAHCTSLYTNHAMLPKLLVQHACASSFVNL